uniref:SKP1-like protein n=1 Tax=Hemiselmis andersenii TaxID=464988 RepID=A0A6T8J7R5_HEMAN|mmetsp:Transcript_22812/g.53033  ORF Transcript_22812/g.53033 Transcript_22812/m.53033 type:complete len:163 (+) Transcript_22812:139-627(+)|eukprot:CAMPEP_0114128064 /NCGR_PEP_ID=MMETSP0043_2-20121206/10729_1 /TAXON_ID=464988 /ORGANISM="Hemiselmis andersenii, Strain CCMP644" /LENGTH=162 /DNA_ID=CAMNT_0001221221 /DNA_START=121 /DNA_END=609 /DNA_ORIENTATION=-
MAESDDEITLETYDKHQVKVSKKIASRSAIIHMMIEDAGDVSEVVPLADKSCTLHIIQRVVEYLKKHAEFEANQAEDEQINAFDKEFQEQSDEIIFQTILAANFLDIKNLLELMCKKVADEIKKCKTPDDIRDRFNIRQDYTPEEVEEVKKAHPWIYDKNAK